MADDLRRLAAVVVLGQSPLARYRPPVRRAMCDGVLVVRALPPATGPNFAMALAAEPAPAAALALTDAVFEDVAAPYELTVDAAYWRDAEPLLAARGFRLVEAEPALVLAPIPDAFPPPPAELSIRRVADATDLAAFYTLSPGARTFVPSVAAATDPAVALLLGSVGGVLVATARVEVVERVADIAGVNTAPEARRRGYGTALSWAAVHAGAASGATAATLTATPMGYPVYERMGFSPACTYRTFRSPDPRT